MLVRQGGGLVTRDQLPRVLSTRTRRRRSRAGGFGTGAGPERVQSGQRHPEPAPRHRVERRRSPLRGEAEGQHGRGAPHGPLVQVDLPRIPSLRPRIRRGSRGSSGPLTRLSGVLSAPVAGPSARCLTDEHTRPGGSTGRCARMLAPLGTCSTTSYLIRRLRAGLVVLCALVALVVQSPDARADTVRPPRAFFGLHDGSMLAYDSLDYGSLRLWDAGVTWPRHRDVARRLRLEPARRLRERGAGARGRGHARAGHDAVVLRAGADAAADRPHGVRRLRPRRDDSLPRLPRLAGHRGVPGLERGQRPHVLDRDARPSSPG